MVCELNVERIINCKQTSDSRFTTSSFIQRQVSKNFIAYYCM